jgi:hypothetical protein
MKLYCYHISPIDFWFGAMTGSQLLKDAWEECQQDWGLLSWTCRRLADLQKHAEEAFKLIHWEGDVREGPYYFGLPGDKDMDIGYMIKQDNNGSCFIASPEPLPFLDSLTCAKCVVEVDRK